MSDIQSAILEGLNSAQAAAVQCVEGPVLIVAGAGSGKTKVLTSRIAYIIASGTKPSRILSLTFTKKAAGEMKERVAALVGPYSASRIYMGTFHSVFIRFLRDYAQTLGYPRQFTIYNRDDSTSLIKSIIKELGLKDDAAYKPNAVLSRISAAKNNLVSPAAYRTNSTAMANDAAAKRPKLIDIYQLYWDRCRATGVMDYDDILFNTNLLFKNDKQALSEVSSRFDYVLVDEYQDTNFAQYLILKMLCAQHHNLCVVGDDSQSIYAFRGARVENILRFQKEYPETKVFKLEQNYRSTRVIVDAANSLIAKNEGRIPKNCFSKGDQGEKIRLLKAADDIEEAQMVVGDIVDRIHSEGAQYGDFAVLYRTNAQSRILEEKLRGRNIPYRIYSGTSFYDRQEVRDALSYFKLVCNPVDDESFKRSIEKPSRGIGQKTLERLAAAASTSGKSLYEAISFEGLTAFGLRESDITRLRSFRDFIKACNETIPSMDAYSLGRKIIEESGLLAFYKADLSVEGKARVGNLEELLNAASQFVAAQTGEVAQVVALAEQAGESYEGSDPKVSLMDFLENISLLSAVDSQNEEELTNVVSLMTVHSAKGLEFPYVFVVGLEENLFPSGGMLASPDEIQEERRLFYVALTRAEKAVEVGFAASRFRNGRTEYNKPSRFIRDIDKKYFQNPIEDYDELPQEEDPFEPFWLKNKRQAGMPFVAKKTPVVAPSWKKPSMSAPKPSIPSSKPLPASSRPLPVVDFEPSPMSELKVGSRVQHNRFGYGTILSLSGAPGDRKAVIDFEQFGQKTLLLKYAKLRLA